MKNVRNASIVFFTIAVLFGCGHRQAQVIADARAGAQAYQQAPSDAQTVIADSVAQNVIAATENIPDLPKPTQTPSEILASPSDYAKQAKVAAHSPPLYDPPSPVIKATPILVRELESFGTWLIRIGEWTIAASLLIIGLSMWPIVSPFLSIVRPFMGEASVLGCLSLLIGAGLSWLGEHPWVIYVTGGLALIVAAIRYRSLWLPLIHTTLKTAPAIKPITATETISPTVSIQLKG